MKVEIKEVFTSTLLSTLSDIVSITPVAATSTIMMDSNGDNSSLVSDYEPLPAGLNEDVDVDAGMLNAMYDLSACVSDNDDENDGQDDSAESQQGRNILMGSSRRSPSSVSISLDGVDSCCLLKKAQHEVPEVIKQVKEKLFGKMMNHHMSQVPPGDFSSSAMMPFSRICRNLSIRSSNLLFCINGLSERGTGVRQ